MIIYNKTWLANQRLHDQLEKDMQRGDINVDEFSAVKAKYPVGFYTPNIFARIGLFILTIIIVSCADGLLSLMAYDTHVVDTFGWFLFLGLLSYVALEVIVRQKNHFCSGVDDALLVLSGGLFVIGFFIIINKNDNELQNRLIISSIVFAISLLLSLRFTDILASTVCCIAFFAFIFFGWTDVMPSGLTTAPFVMMAVSGGVYWVGRNYSVRAAYINYRPCLIIVQVISLLSLYAAGNYYIIQTLGNEMKGGDSQTHTAIPFGAFFWAWTILLPFIYLGFGIRKKDVFLLRVGLALIAAAIFTFRNYYHLLPVDIMLTIGGVVVLGIIYAVTKYLKTPKYGFTRDDEGDANDMDKLKVESLIVAQPFAHTPHVPANDGVKFGGGDFGGGGSSGGF